VIEENATVTRCDGEFAEVETERKSSCGSCSATGVCGTAALAKVFGNRPSIVRVLNPIGAKPGDNVVVGIQESVLVRVSFVFYMIPIVGLIAGAIAGQSMALRFGSSGVELISIIGGLLGLMFGLYLVRRFSIRTATDERYRAVILRRAEQVKVDFRAEFDNSPEE
jgi:sigma-E factor negative regulatory protein RseC